MHMCGLFYTYPKSPRGRSINCSHLLFLFKTDSRQVVSLCASAKYIHVHICHHAYYCRHGSIAQMSCINIQVRHRKQHIHVVYCRLAAHTTFSYSHYIALQREVYRILSVLYCTLPYSYTVALQYITVALQQQVYRPIRTLLLY